MLVALDKKITLNCLTPGKFNYDFSRDEESLYSVKTLENTIVHHIGEHINKKQIEEIINLGIEVFIS